MTWRGPGVPWRKMEGVSTVTERDRYNYSFDPEGEDWAARLLRRVPQGAHVLELGPGPGAMTRVLLDRGHSVTVIENDPEALATLKALDVEVLSVDLNATKWCDQLRERRFGAILACDVLEHLNQPEATLRALRALAEPAAPLIVSVPNVAYGGLIAGLYLGRFEYTATGLLDRTHVRFFTRNSLTKALIESGWAPEYWDGYRLPIEHSEFVWAWQQLGQTQRQALILGSPEFDIYEWMTVATPISDVVAASAAATDREMVELKRELHALMQVHEQEHTSLIEHQKAFAEARIAIAGKEEEVRHLALAAEQLRNQHSALANELTERTDRLTSIEAELESVRQELSGLRLHGWPGRMRRLLSALRR